MLSPVQSQNVIIDNAGLVLLWPFLHRYFSVLQLLAEDGKAFTNSNARDKAIALLHHLATGGDIQGTHRLPLNNLLCGAGADHDAVCDVAITAQEQELSQNMLNAVKQHWGKLGSTSVAGFRETFILRHGALTAGDDKYTLTVQPQTFDMLLDTLPWSYGTIKLPWMNSLLYTTWR